MAPPNSFYVPVNHGGQQSVDDFDTYSVKNRIVNSVHEIVDDFSKTITTTFATINEEDNNDIGDFLRPVDSAVNAISGNQGTDYPDVGSTVVQETANNIFNDVTTEIHRFTDFFNDEDSKHIFSEHNFSEDKSSPNTPYIILVVILAILVVVTIVALIVYQKRKTKNSKNITGVTIIGKTFDKSESDEKQEAQMPQQIMYGEQ